MLRYLIAEAYNDIVNVVHRDMTLEAVLTKWLLNRVTKRLGLHKLFIGRMTIKLPDGVKIYINDEATIYISISLTIISGKSI
jgi:hypothetical protein